MPNVRCLAQAIETLPAFFTELFDRDVPIRERDAFVLISARKNAIQEQSMPQRARRTRQCIEGRAIAGQRIDRWRRRAGEWPARLERGTDCGRDKEAIPKREPRERCGADAAEGRSQQRSCSGRSITRI